MKYVGKAYFEAGKGWHYSNTNYLVLGMLAEAVGGGPIGRPGAGALPSTARSRPHLVSARGQGSGRRRSRLPLRIFGPDGARDRPVGWHSARAVHLGRDRCRRRRRFRGERGRPRALGARPVRRRRPHARVSRGYGRCGGNRRPSKRRSRMATACRRSRSTACERSVTRVACSASGQRCAISPIRVSRSPC